VIRAVLGAKIAPVQQEVDQAPTDIAGGAGDKNVFFLGVHGKILIS
jgi:hypothetical protein